MMKIAYHNAFNAGVLLGCSLVALYAPAAGCSPPAATSPRKAALNVCRSIYALATRSHKEDPDASARISRLIRSVRKPEVLHGIALWSHERIYTDNSVSQTYISERYRGAFEESLGALAHLGSDEAAKRLVYILREGMCDGHDLECLAEAITFVGKPTLRYLESLPEKDWVAKSIIAAIRAGKILR